MMAPAEMMALQFMQASVGCLAAGGSAWALLTLACRRWPALAVSRWAWVLAQALTVAAFLFVLVPERAQLSVMPPIELAAGPQAAVAQAGVFEAAVDAAPNAVAGTAGRWLLFAAQAWLALYIAGMFAAAIRLARAQRALRRLVRGATRLDAPHDHAGFGDVPPGLAVFETTLAVSPMLIGAWRPVLLLPCHLRDFDVQQQQMVIAHELTHLRRGDPLLMAASIAAQTLLWFNPAMRKLGERLTWAQELGCDQQVLAGRPQPQRQAYAAALVGQLKLQRAGFGAALAFGGISATSLTARMLLIRQGGARALSAVERCAVLAACAAAFIGSAILQPAFAWRIDSVRTPVPAAPIKWQAPLQQPRVSSFYGEVSPLRSREHDGIDFAARSGTPVLASADGTVASSTDLDPGGAKYGKTILVTHANGLSSFYAHLDRRLVAAGDAVTAGQTIGMSGATGKVTGPHLHFEVRQDGRAVNPEAMLAGLEANATRRALRARAASPSAN
ncbi:peptidase [Massilia eurypsychrophila]|jgi:murein DD-endopeptidase MepM/ murein hydrolase activator NlpD|uniref:Peptidase n=1 Tax=Massilia eurypsychrophila TaxID=1485217 RepID=A0A2G8THT0_9BURK|nr:peptidoglycan DD-metalloendopeptidase family protein [Massilia eurypsychrophila]PIL45611.1 peptidase [Massilia eurypsychrophila]